MSDQHKIDQQDWPRLKLATRVAAGIMVAIVAVQGILIIGAPLGSKSSDYAHWAGLVFLAVCAFVATWTALRNRDHQIVWLAALDLTGITLRVAGILPFTYLASSDTMSNPSPLSVTLIALGYGCLLAALGIGALGSSRIVRSDWRVALIAAGSATLIAGALWFAAFGPLPGMPTELTQRDYFALALFVPDWLCAVLSFYATLALLRLPGGTYARAWVWISVGAVLSMMGDVVMPVLEPADAPYYGSVLYGLALSLILVGCMIWMDIQKWHRERGDAIDLVVPGVPARRGNSSSAA
jgi:hypothetical protein